MIYYFSGIMKSKAFHDSMVLFNKLIDMSNIHVSFIYDDYNSFLNNVYEIYSCYDEIYKYREDIRRCIVHVFNKNIQNGKNDITISDIIDSLSEINSIGISNDVVGIKTLYKNSKDRRRL